MRVLVGALTWPNVAVKDLHVSVSVRSGLFMVEAQSMENFVLHRSNCHTASLTQGDVLSPPLTAYVGRTTEAHTHGHKVNSSYVSNR